MCGTENRLGSLATLEPRSSHPSSSIPAPALASALVARTPASLMYSTPPEAALHTRSGSNTNSGLNKRSDHSQLANRKACGWTREGEHRGDELQLFDGRALCHSQTGRATTIGWWTGEPGPKSPTEAAAGTASAILKILQPLEFRAPLTYAGSPETAAGPPPKLGKPGSSRRVRGQPAAPVSPPVRVPGTSIHDEVRPRVGDHPGTAPSQPMANRMGRHLGDRKKGTKELR